MDPQPPFIQQQQQQLLQQGNQYQSLPLSANLRRHASAPNPNALGPPYDNQQVGPQGMGDGPTAPSPFGMTPNRMMRMQQRILPPQRMNSNPQMNMPHMTPTRVQNYPRYHPGYQRDMMMNIPPNQNVNTSNNPQDVNQSDINTRVNTMPPPALVQSLSVGSQPTADPQTVTPTSESVDSAFPKFGLDDFPSLGADAEQAPSNNKDDQGFFFQKKQQQRPNQPGVNNEFNILQEDFPALASGNNNNNNTNNPASNNGNNQLDRSSSQLYNQNNANAQSNTPGGPQQDMRYSNNNAPPPAGRYNQQQQGPYYPPPFVVPGNGMQQPPQSQMQHKPVLLQYPGQQQSPPTSHPPTQHAPKVESDSMKYGLSGLLPIIRMSDPNLNMLALGTDLTTLGLSLNSPDVLYATLAHPTLDNPTRSVPEYILPYCYYMQPPALKTSHLSKFSIESLFYIFYNMPTDTLQVYAAKELYTRNWLYHKELKLWFMEDTRNKNDSGSKSFLCFDVASWQQKTFNPSMLPNGLEFLSKEELAQL